jgi:hypothetical protein
MRSFLGKIFACMLLVPILARGGGMLLEATLSDPRPQSERVLAMAMPAVAGLVGSELSHGGQQAVRNALDRSNGLLRLLPPTPHCGTGGQGVVVTVPGAAGLCLSAVPPPRPRVLGLLPASLWYLLPMLELLCCGIVSFFLARYLAEPILRTRAAAAAFAAGDLSARAVQPRR